MIGAGNANNMLQNDGGKMMLAKFSGTRDDELKLIWVRDYFLENGQQKTAGSRGEMLLVHRVGKVQRTPN